MSNEETFTPEHLTREKRIVELHKQIESLQNEREHIAEWIDSYNAEKAIHRTEAILSELKAEDQKQLGKLLKRRAKISEKINNTIDKIADLQNSDEAYQIAKDAQTTSQNASKIASRSRLFSIISAFFTGCILGLSGMEHRRDTKTKAADKGKSLTKLSSTKSRRLENGYHHTPAP